MENGLQPGAQIHAAAPEAVCCAPHFIPHTTAAGTVLWSPAEEETEGQGWLQLIRGRTGLNLHLRDSLHGFPDSSGRTLGRSSRGCFGQPGCFTARIKPPMFPEGASEQRPSCPRFCLDCTTSLSPGTRGPPAASLGSPGLSVFATPAPGKRSVHAALPCPTTISRTLCAVAGECHCLHFAAGAGSGSFPGSRGLPLQSHRGRVGRSSKLRPQHRRSPGLSLLS